MAFFAYVYSKALELQTEPKVGDRNCVALVQHYTKVGHTSTWRPGLRVMDSVHLSLGTVIATFENGVYPNRPKGNHACFFLDYGPISQSTGKPMYITVMDQWLDKRRISLRRIDPRGKLHSQGNIYHDSDNADAFYVGVVRR